MKLIAPIVLAATLALLGAVGVAANHFDSALEKPATPPSVAEPPAVAPSEPAGPPAAGSGVGILWWAAAVFVAVIGFCLLLIFTRLGEEAGKRKDWWL